MIYSYHNISADDISDKNISEHNISIFEIGGVIMEKNVPLTEANFYILLAVRKPNHGYGIIQEVSDLTKGRVVLGAGTLYGALQALEKKGFIEIYSADEGSRKKKEYILSEAGKIAFFEETKRLEELLENAKLMGGN